MRLLLSLSPIIVALIKEKESSVKKVQVQENSKNNYNMINIFYCFLKGKNTAFYKILLFYLFIFINLKVS